MLIISSERKSIQNEHMLESKQYRLVGMFMKTAHGFKTKPLNSNWVFGTPEDGCAFINPVLSHQKECLGGRDEDTLDTCVELVKV